MFKFLRFNVCTLLFLGAIAPGTFAQQTSSHARVVNGDGQEISVIHVTGVVRDVKGVPIAGVAVTANQTRQGVLTDANGAYSLRVPKDLTLSFSFLGFETQRQKADREKINVVLKESALDVGEVVVTGYKTASIRETTGSVSVISGKDLNDVPMKNMDMLLQGKLPGVSVQSVSGQPGAIAKIRIRGQNSITGDSEPLWVIDGVPLQKNLPNISRGNLKAGDFSTLFTTGIGNVNPSDIESITVLKDAASAAIYGSQAANGVIVVTTKKGRPGRMRVTYSGNVSVLFKPQRDAELMNSRQKLAWEQELWNEFAAPSFAFNQAEYEKQLQNPSYIPQLQRLPIIGAVGMIRAGKGRYAGLTLNQQDQEIARLGEQSTDWFDALFRNSISHSHDVNFSGGKDDISYYVSLGYLNSNGLVMHTNHDRYSFRTQLNMTPNKKLSWGIIADMSVQQGQSPANMSNIFDYAYFANPYERLYNDDGSYAADNTYYTMPSNNGAAFHNLPDNGYNILREVKETSSNALSVSANLSANVRYLIFKDLTFSGIGSFSYSNDKSTTNIGPNTYTAFLDRPFEPNWNSQRKYGSNTINNGITQSYMLRGQFDYNKSLGQGHRIALIAGSEIRGSDYAGSAAKRYGYDDVTGIHQTPVFPNNGSGFISYEDYLSYRNIMDANLSENVTKQTFASFYGEVDYFYHDRYGLTLTGRADGSNNFGSKEQFNLIWSVGAFWNIDREAFMQSTVDVIDNLTLRVSTGVTGNINRTVSPILIMRYGPFRESESGFYRTGDIRNAPNPYLRWEKKRDMKVSLSAGFIQRINVSVEFYRTKGIDQVTAEQVPYTTGYSIQSYNTSEQINQGIEFSLSTVNIKTRDFSWTTSFNLAWNQNILTKYQPYGFAPFSANAVGYPLNSIFGSRVIGINKGDGLYDYEARSDTDGRVSSENHTFYLGTQQAPWNGGFHMNFTYKNLSLSVGSSFALGAKIENDITAPQDYASMPLASSGNGKLIQRPSMDIYTHHFNVRQDASNRWTAANPRTGANPRIIDVYSGNYDITARPIGGRMTRGILLENLSYFKINSISLSYSLPAKAVKAIKMESISFSLMVNNLLTITNYSGLDPEAPGATYPQSRSMSFGVSLGF